MAARRPSNLSLDNSRGKVQQKLRRFRQKVKSIPWLPESLQKPEPLASRRFPNANISSCHLDGHSESGASPLLRLPAEIRLKIYGYVIQHPDRSGDAGPSTDDFAVSDGIREFPINCIWRVPGRLIAKPLHYHVAEYKPHRLNLLLTCKKLYAEAIDLYYSLPTFFLSDISVFVDFTSSLLPQRLATIRHLHLQFLLRWPAIAMWWDNPTGRPDNAMLWSNVWEFIAAKLTGLRTLRLFIRQFSWNLDQPAVESERRVLRPVAELRGLKEFRLWYRHEHVRAPFGQDCVHLYTTEIRGHECMVREAVENRQQVCETVLGEP